jgi:hypothetical protein
MESKGNHMKPENHAIRELEACLADASPEVTTAIERVILSLKACVLNRKDPAALAMCQRALAEETAALEKAMRS